MHAKNLARPLFCSLFLLAGCVDEWGGDGFNDDFDSNSRGNGACTCNDNSNSPGINQPGDTPDAFVVSVLNGCETCTRSHEKALKDGGATPEKIHELARLAAVASGLKALIKENA